jgi:hypothetical protein
VNSLNVPLWYLPRFCDLLVCHESAYLYVDAGQVMYVDAGQVG